MFIPFLPSYIFSVRLRSWKAYTKTEILNKLKQLVKYPPSTSMLYLIENLTTAVEAYMKAPTKKVAPHLHKVKIFE